MARKLFFDTYALVEIFKGNPRYDRYKDGITMLLNKLNLLEFAYVLLREGKGDHIPRMVPQLAKFSVEYDDDILMRAAKMKHDHLKKRLSFVDCIGYLLAKKHRAKFLTGDEHFRHSEGVEFVK